MSDNNRHKSNRPFDLRANLNAFERFNIFVPRRISETRFAEPSSAVPRCIDLSTLKVLRTTWTTLERSNDLVFRTWIFRSAPVDTTRHQLLQSDGLVQEHRVALP